MGLTAEEKELLVAIINRLSARVEELEAIERMYTYGVTDNKEPKRGVGEEMSNPGYTAKLKNRRVSVHRKEGGVELTFVRLNDKQDTSPLTTARIRHFKNERITETSINLSDEAFDALTTIEFMLRSEKK